MIEQLETFKSNILALEAIDVFTETDEKYVQKLFLNKLDEGYDTINLLIKLDELKISKTSVKVFFEDTVFTLRNYKKLGHLAIVAHSNILKALVPIDNLFFQRSSKGRLERYFDVSQLEEAFNFVKENAV